MEEKILLKFFKGNNEQSLKNTTIQPNCFYYVKDNYGLKCSNVILFSEKE